jgi:hypothetical protein
MHDNINSFDQYRLWIIVGVGLMSVFLLWTVWRHYYYLRRRPKDGPTDYGLVYLMAGIGMWALLSIMKLSIMGTTSTLDSLQVHFMSMINNAFLLSSLPFFEYSQLLSNKQHLKRYWATISFVSALAVLVIIFFIHQNNKTAADLLDWGFSTIIFLILGGFLLRTFSKRRLVFIGYLALLVMFMTIFSQFIITFSSGQGIDTYGLVTDNLRKIGYIIGGISFAMMLILLVALAFTWILAENHVLEDWEGDVKARDFWMNHQGSWKTGVVTLRDSMSEGLSRVFLKKCTLLFFLNEFPYRDHSMMEGPRKDIFNITGRFAENEKSYQRGLIEPGDYHRTKNTIREFLTTWLAELISIFNQIEIEEANNLAAAAAPPIDPQANPASTHTAL